MTWISIARMDLLGDDEAAPIQLGDKKLALFRSKGEFFVTDNVCTHQYALLSDGFVENGCVECPLHQASFDLKTGEALCAPATKAIRSYPVKTDGQTVFVDPS